MLDINWPIIRAKLKEAVLTLPHFIKNPVRGMRMLPDWDWPTILILQAAFAAICGVLGNLLDRNILGMFTAIFLAPLGGFLVIGIGAGILYYIFMFGFQREIPYRQVYLHLFFAALPVSIVGIVSGIVPPIIIVGAAACMLLLFVSFVDVFQLERSKSRDLLLVMFGLYFIFWATQLVRTSNSHQKLLMKATPESLDILQKEMDLGE